MNELMVRMIGSTPLALTFEFLIRIIIASILGAIVGIERSKRQKEAGIRTHSVVACATAVFMILSKYCFADLQLSMIGITLDGIRGADPARIAAQVVTGLGFLGAGVIFKTGNSIKGLTTAAGLWTTAAVGMAIGSGMYIVGFFTALVLVIIQVATHKFAMKEGVIYINQIKVVTRRLMDLQGWINSQFGQEAKITGSSIICNEDNTITYLFTLNTDRDPDLEHQIELLGKKENIVSISVSREQTI